MRCRNIRKELEEKGVKMPKNYHLPLEEWITLLKGKGVFMKETCPDCGVGLFERHKSNCDITCCSNCGTQRLTCECKTGHNPWFSAWRGYWPGRLERVLFGFSKEEFKYYKKLFLVNPLNPQPKLLDILVVFDQSTNIDRDDADYYVRRAEEIGAVITTAFISEDPKVNTKLLREIRKNKPKWVIPYTGEKRFIQLENIP